MSLRLLIILGIFAVSIYWTLKRPYYGVLLNIILFHLNLRVFGTGLEDIRFQFIATLALLASMFMNSEELKEPEAPLQLPIKVLFGFTFFVFMTSTWAVSDSKLAFESALDFSKIVLFAFLMVKLVKTEDEVKILVWVLLGCIWYTSFMARWGVEFDWIDEVEVGIATGGTGTHLMMHLPLLITLAMLGSKYERIAAYCIIPFMLDGITVLPSGLRSTFVSLVVVGIAYFILAPGKLRAKSTIPLGFGAIIFLYVFVPPDYLEYMKTVLNPSSESSAASRNTINDATWEIIAEYPMGIGFNNYSRISMNYLPEDNLTDEGTRDAHNAFLKTMAEFGMLGFIVWMLMFITAYFFFRRVRKAHPMNIAPNRLQLYAFAFSVGLISIGPGLYTHSYNDLDTLYWFVALSCILYNIEFRKQEEVGPEKKAKPSQEEMIKRARELQEASLRNKRGPGRAAIPPLR